MIVKCLPSPSASLVRRLVLGTLLIAASPAMADCGWVLWTKNAVNGKPNPSDVYPNEAACEKEGQRRIVNFVAGMKKDHGRVYRIADGGRTAIEEGSGSGSLVHMRCWPVGVNPTQ